MVQRAVQGVCAPPVFSRCIWVIQGTFPINVLNLVTSAMSLLPDKTTYSQVLRIRIGTTFVCYSITPSGGVANNNSNQRQWVRPLFSHKTGSPEVGEFPRLSRWPRFYLSTPPSPSFSMLTLSFFSTCVFLVIRWILQPKTPHYAKQRGAFPSISVRIGLLWQTIPSDSTYAGS
jgi:hypothetical protein